MERFGPEVTIRFIHDRKFIRSSIHRCNAVQEWFEERPEVELVWPELPQMEQFEWPSKGADLNPIENAWKMLKTALTDRQSRFRNADELFASAKNIWKGLGRDPSYWNNLATSMPKRLKMVRTYRGGWTNF